MINIFLFFSQYYKWDEEQNQENQEDLENQEKWFKGVDF